MCTARGAAAGAGKCSSESARCQSSSRPGRRETAWPTDSLRCRPATAGGSGTGRRAPSKRRRPCGVPVPARVQHRARRRAARRAVPPARRGAARRCRRDGPSEPAARPGAPTPSSAPARRAARSAGSACSRTCGKPAWASPTAPPTPYRTAGAARRATSCHGGRVPGRGSRPAAPRRRPPRRASPAHRGPGAEQAQRPQRAAVGVHPAGGPQHGRLAGPADDAERGPQLGADAPIALPPRRTRRMRRAATRRMRAACGRSMSECAPRSPPVDQPRLGRQVGLGPRARPRPVSAMVCRGEVCRGAASRCGGDHGHQSLNCAGGSYSPPDQATRSSMLRAASRDRSASRGLDLEVLGEGDQAVASQLLDPAGVGAAARSA